MHDERWKLYRLLAEPMRLRLLALTAQEEFSIGELAELLNEAQPNISRHLKSLREANLVSVRKEGTRVYLRFNEQRTDPVVKDALSTGQQLCEEDGSFARINGILQAREAPARAFFAKTSTLLNWPKELEHIFVRFLHSSTLDVLRST